MANVVVTGLTWESKVLTIEGASWPFIQINVQYDAGTTTLDDYNTFDFTGLFSTTSDVTATFAGGVTSCVYSGYGLGIESYHGSGQVKLHRKVGSVNAGTLLYYDNQDYGYFYETTGSGAAWRNTVDYQFVIYDGISNKYYVPKVRGYLLISRWTDPQYMGVADLSGNPYAQVAAGDYSSGDTSYRSNLHFYYVQAISDILATAKGKTTDPYEKEGESGTGGGEGDLDGSGDDIEVPDLPQDSAADSKFITLFNPSLAQLQALASYMWSSSFDLDTFKKLFANPMDCILGLSIVPVEIPNGGTRAVTVGNISTGVSMTTAASQYVEVDCGTLNVNEYWGAYLDYEPYTKAEIYLPYIGTHAISVDDIMNKAVHVVYHVDILSGACAAYVEVDGTVLYQFIGQCASSIPVTGRDWTNMINGVLSIAGAVGSMVATGGASAPMASGVIASTAVNMMKPNIEKSGSMSGTGGLMAVQTPYIILTRPRQAVPSNQNTYMGYPSFITVSMDDLDGYTEVEHVHLEGMSATANEVSEIESMLLKGVIF